jgi:hypothetical protein
VSRRRYLRAVVRRATIRGYAQDQQLADPHHHLPGPDFNAAGRIFVEPPRLLQMIVDLVDYFRLVISQIP